MILLIIVSIVLSIYCILDDSSERARQNYMNYRGRGAFRK